MAELNIARDGVLCPPFLAPDAPALPPPSDTVVSCYDNRVPPFAEPELERLYRSIHATAGMFRFDGSIASANTYAARRNGEHVSLLLYRRERSIVTVLNRSISIGGEEIERFADTIFRRYRKVSAIVFNAVQPDIRNISYPCQRHRCGEDIVATLPHSPEVYFASLGKDMRVTIERCRERLAREYPSFRFQAFVNDEADEHRIRALYRLRHAGMETAGQASSASADEIERIVKLVKTHGLVTIATIDGRVCGGMVCWRAGDNYFVHTIAHDAQYDGLDLDTLCCHDTIRECIERGGKAFHFSPGRMPHKFRFLGTERPYDRIVVYRSRLRLLQNPRLALKTALRR
ncbi:MAG TPA: GNAT family N-acetyltransferase [Paucimonas sp.]|nr:GNAT family N-acetyltransferase [Paucimonas sp.]